MPINWTGQGDTYVGIEFSNIPVCTRVVLKDANTGRATPSPSNALINGGAGTARIPYPVGLPAGDYYVVGELNGEWVAQTVEFHCNGGPVSELPP